MDSKEGQKGWKVRLSSPPPVIVTAHCQPLLLDPRGIAAEHVQFTCPSEHQVERLSLPGISLRS